MTAVAEAGLVGCFGGIAGFVIGLLSGDGETGAALKADGTPWQRTQWPRSTAH
jgi:hypothetical protein